MGLDRRSPPGEAQMCRNEGPELAQQTAPTHQARQGNAAAIAAPGSHISSTSRRVNPGGHAPAPLLHTPGCTPRRQAIGPPDAAGGSHETCAGYDTRPKSTCQCIPPAGAPMSTAASRSARPFRAQSGRAWRISWLWLRQAPSTIRRSAPPSPCLPGSEPPRGRLPIRHHARFRESWTA